MKIGSRTLRFASCLALGLAFSPAALAHGEKFSAGEPGDPRRASRTIEVVMRERDGRMIYIPSRIEVRRGEQIRFVLRNEGEIDHEFLLATEAENIKHAEEMMKNPDMEHDDPNGKRLKPKTTAEMLWRFTIRGTFEYGCLIPGHREGGMIGHVVVK